MFFLFKLDFRTQKNSLSSRFLDPSSGLLHSLTSWCGGLTRWGFYFLSANKTISEQANRENSVSMAFYLINYSCTHPSKQEKFCFVRTRKGIFNFILFDLTKSHYFLRASKGVRASVKSAVNIYLNTAFSLMNASVQKIIIPYLIKILGKYQFWKLLHDLSSYCLNVPLAHLVEPGPLFGFSDLLHNHSRVHQAINPRTVISQSSWITRSWCEIRSGKAEDTRRGEIGTERVVL